MQLITEVKDDATFLSMTYDVAEVVEEIIEKTGIMEIRKQKPKGLQMIYDSDDEKVKEEKEAKNKALIKEQANKNLSQMARKLLKEYPEEAVKLVHALCKLDIGEQYPKGFELFNTLMKVFTNTEFLGFFISSMRLVRGNTDKQSQE